MKQVDHEWLTVLDRRWCLGCSAFQSRHPQAGWMPYAGAWCPADSSYAARRDAGDQQGELRL